jgi:hypothetical protein
MPSNDQLFLFPILTFVLSSNNLLLTQFSVEYYVWQRKPSSTKIVQIISRFKWPYNWFFNERKWMDKSFKSEEELHVFINKLLINDNSGLLISRLLCVLVSVFFDGVLLFMLLNSERYPQFSNIYTFIVIFTDVYWMQFSWRFGKLHFEYDAKT